VEDKFKREVAPRAPSSWSAFSCQVGPRPAGSDGRDGQRGDAARDCASAHPSTGVGDSRSRAASAWTRSGI